MSLQKILLFIFLLYLLPINLFSQKEQINWFFGRHGGLNFNGPVPTVLTGGQIDTREGVSSISDKTTGQLLFYTEGTSVWNRNNTLMPNGTGLLGDFSSTQSSIIIPNPNSTNKYYLFTTALNLGMHYSEVDMNLNGGLGDIVVATKNTSLIPSNQSSEKLIAVQHCNKRDYWVITHILNSNAFYVFLVNPAGIQLPLIYNIGQTLGNSVNWEGVGYLKLSVDGSKIAHVIGPASSGAFSNVELLNFNNSTGVISAPLVQLTNLNFPYGAEFSPNGRFLYISETLGQKIHQYDLSAPDINASKITLATSLNLNFGSLQLGPNGKIYVSAENGYDIGYNYLGVINYPNLQGSACNYIQDAISLSPGQSKIGLPTFAANFLLKDSAVIDFSTNCINTNGIFSFSGVTNIDSVKWDFGDGSSLSQLNSPTHTYTAAGIYNVRLITFKSCNVSDTFHKDISITNCAIVTPNFTIPDTVCVNEQVNITNTSTNATTYYWNFCVSDINQTPIGSNLGNFGGAFGAPVFMDYVQENGNYYGFLTNYAPGKLLRLDFGSSLLNIPTVTDLGNFGGTIPLYAEGIQVVKNEGKWYAIMVAGYPPASTPCVLKVEFGTNITNPSPVATSWGNIGNLLQPVDLHVFQDAGNWYGFTVNAENNTITRFNFTNSFDNAPTAVNLGNVGNLSYPTGIYAIKDGTNWRVFITNAGNNTRTSGIFSLSRLDFGSSLLNTPTGVNLGNPGGLLRHPRDLTIMNFCGQVIGFAVNGLFGSNDIVKMNFNNDLTSTPTVSSLGNIGNLSFPHSISKFFRAGSDLYSFITNVDNGTITRLQFAGCTNSNIPNYTGPTPPPVTYNQPGTYTINLTVDDGLPTQSSVCKQIVVMDCVTSDTIINDYTPAITFNPCTNKLTVEDASAFHVGDTVLLIQMKGAVIDSSNNTNFGNITNYKNAGNYEFNYIKSISANDIELLNTITRSYDLPFGKVQLIRVPYYQNIKFTARLTCLPWDGSKGGVLALNVQDILTLNASVDISAKGFKGAPPTYNSTYHCDIDSLYILNTNGIDGSRKGESVFLNLRMLFGRGKVANAGGGGNATNAGGGGGGNGGNGGSGGKQYIGPLCNTNFQNSGIGGSALNYSNTTNKIFLGGGGGAGQMNDATIGGAGNGGGIAIINTKFLKTNNYSILSEGETPIHMSGPNDDGRSGGGGGGTVLLNYTTLLDNVTISVKGGNGDYCVISPPNLHGPGGGGGGGIVWINQTSYTANITTTLSGGASGTNINNDPWGATNGTTGNKLTGLIIPIDQVLFKLNIDSVRIKDSLTSCTAFDFKGSGYTNTNPITSWQWFFGDGQSATTQNTSHTYTPGPYTVKLIVTDVNGCKDSITKNIIASTLSVNAGNDTTICSGQSIQLQASTNGGTQFQWSPAVYLNNNSVLNPSATPPDGTTTFVITATHPSGCSQKDSVTIFVRSQNSFSVNSPAPICQNDSVQLFAQGGDIYLWQPSAGINSTIANPFVKPQTTTIYSVQITDTVCSFSQDLSTQVLVRPLPNVQAMKQNDIDCIVDFSQLTATGALQYLWSPAATLNNPTISSPIARPTVTTKYIVRGTDQSGCTNYDTLVVEVGNTGIPGGYQMPGAFTPNNDGLNDCFGIKYWGVILELEFNIFNRWGELVFHTTNPADCWNGKFRGVEQKSDVYVYWIRAKTICETSVIRKGVVALIR